MEKYQDGTIELTQANLTEATPEDLRIQDNSKPLPTPCVTTIILQVDLFGENSDNHFNYRSLIGKLSYLAKSTSADIEYEYASHQSAHFFMVNPKKSHDMAIKGIGH